MDKKSSPNGTMDEEIKKTDEVNLQEFLCDIDNTQSMQNIENMEKNKEMQAYRRMDSEANLSELSGLMCVANTEINGHRFSAANEFYQHTDSSPYKLLSKVAKYYQKVAGNNSPNNEGEEIFGELLANSLFRDNLNDKIFFGNKNKADKKLLIQLLVKNIYGKKISRNQLDSSYNKAYQKFYSALKIDLGINKVYLRNIGNPFARAVTLHTAFQKRIHTIRNNKNKNNIKYSDPLKLVQKMHDKDEKVHAEMQILFQILKDIKKNGKQNAPFYIGLSKKCCQDCNIMLHATNIILQEKFGDEIDKYIIYRGAHNIAYTDRWRLPLDFANSLANSTSGKIIAKYNEIRNRLDAMAIRPALEQYIEDLQNKHNYLKHALEKLGKKKNKETTEEEIEILKKEIAVAEKLLKNPSNNNDRKKFLQQRSTKQQLGNIKSKIDGLMVKITSTQKTQKKLLKKIAELDTNVTKLTILSQKISALKKEISDKKYNKGRKAKLIQLENKLNSLKNKNLDANIKKAGKQLLLLGEKITHLKTKMEKLQKQVRLAEDFPGVLSRHVENLIDTYENSRSVDKDTVALRPDESDSEPEFSDSEDHSPRNFFTDHLHDPHNHGEAEQEQEQEQEVKEKSDSNVNIQLSQILFNNSLSSSYSSQNSFAEIKNDSELLTQSLLTKRKSKKSLKRKPKDNLKKLKKAQKEYDATNNHIKEGRPKNENS
ncbi:MAG: hypothetical protein COB50_02600 [Thiotrichales bacterium]|nr:MAG: hypothetical protein COB50_02600 [Thiotrichales bacterium]